MTTEKKEPKKKEGLSALISAVNKKYGEGTVQDFSKEKRVNVPVISTGLPSLDYILGGGFPKGRVIEIYGKPASGKTTMAYTAIANAQKQGGKALYIDVECAFDPSYAEKIGVDLNKLLVSQPNSAEQALDLVNDFAKTGEVSVIALDSVAALVPRADTEKEIDGSHGIAGRARILSRALPLIANSASKNGCTVIFINQIRTNVGVMYGNPNITPGGMSLKFTSSTRIEIRARKPEERGGNEGQPVLAVIKKNKLAQPFQETELFLAYGKGFDTVLDLIEVAVTFKLLIRGGAYYSYIWDKENKFMGKASVSEDLVNSDINKNKILNFIKTGEIPD